MAPRHVAILGGGITGLSSAFHLSRRFPTCLITLVNDQPRFGGWVDSQRVKVGNAPTSPEMLLEAGPRTLRPNAKSVLELIHTLDLKDDVVTVPRTSSAARTRFLYIPETDSTGLTAIPSTISGVLRSSLRSILIPAVVREPFRRANRGDIGDESVDSFLQRRFGERFARTFGSALVHGIYAADSRTVSIRAAFPSLWAAETVGRGSVVRGLLRDSLASKPNDDEDYVLGDTRALMQGVSVFSFRDGMSTLTSALEQNLRNNPNVTLVANTTVQSLRITADGGLQVHLVNSETLNPTHVVSALPLPALACILPSSAPLPHLTDNALSSVTLVNLVFPSTLSNSATPLHPAGFGYLIPRPSTGYDKQHAGILGVVFDSCALASQDSDDAGDLTKLTMMLGGPHPITPEHISIPSLLRTLAIHLGVSAESMPAPLLSRVFEHRNCIPLPGVGHLERMKKLQVSLAQGPWDGRLAVIGAGVKGVSVADCVESGKKVGINW